MNMLSLFQKGGPIMWPLFATSVISLTVVFERLIFIVRENRRRDPEKVEEFFSLMRQGHFEAAIDDGNKSKDFVIRALTYGLKNRTRSFSEAVLRAANRELKRFSRGLHILDTVITLAPLLGLLATVTGMIHAFGVLGNKELDAPTVITGGIAEALIGTAFGLGIAIVALIPFNYLNSKMEDARHEMEDAATHAELLLNALR